MSEQEKKSPIKPFKTFRQGAVAASVWRRQAPSGFEYFDFSVSRSWKATTTGKEGYRVKLIDPRLSGVSVAQPRELFAQPPVVFACPKKQH